MEVFHTCYLVVGSSDCIRRTWHEDEINLHAACRFAEFIDQGTMGKIKLFPELPPVNVQAVKANDTLILYAEMQDQIITAGLLVLSGNDPKAEEQSCKEFQQAMSFRLPTGGKWILPLPPLEIESRPLIYEVIYFKNGHYTAWDRLIFPTIQVLNAIGLGFIRTVKNLTK